MLKGKRLYWKQIKGRSKVEDEKGRILKEKGDKNEGLNVHMLGS